MNKLLATVAVAAMLTASGAFAQAPMDPAPPSGTMPADAAPAKSDEAMPAKKMHKHHHAKKGTHHHKKKKAADAAAPADAAK